MRQEFAFLCFGIPAAIALLFFVKYKLAKPEQGPKPLPVPPKLYFRGFWPRARCCYRDNDGVPCGITPSVVRTWEGGMISSYCCSVCGEKQMKPRAEHSQEITLPIRVKAG